jgi:hypothetical protein
MEHQNISCYGSGIDLNSYREYMRTEIQCGREIARVTNERTDIAGKDVLDVGYGYTGPLIVMKEAGRAQLSAVSQWMGAFRQTR